MADFTLDDYEIFKKILNWNGRKLNVNPEQFADWKEETLNSFGISNEDIERFKENVVKCSLDSRTRKKAEQQEEKYKSLIEASKKVAIVKDTIYFLHNNRWTASIKERARLTYEALGQSSKFSEFSDFVLYNSESQKKEFFSFKTQFIPVGSRFFDVKNGKMVDDASDDEFRTYGFNREIDYNPINFKDCKSKLMTDLIRALGGDNLKYILLNIAYNLADNSLANRRALILVGESRSGKGTIVQVLKNIGICPDKDLSSELSNNDDFFDMLSETIPIYPVVAADECEKVNMQTIKKLCSDATTGINRKGDKQITVSIRSFIILTANRVPKSSLTGLTNKITIIKSQNSYKQEIDPLYWDKIESEGYDEFISLLLNMTHKLTIKGWNPSMMPESVEKTNYELCSEFLYHDAFFNAWEKDSTVQTDINDAYRHYLFWANPDIGSYDSIRNAVAESRISPNRPPNGLVGVSRTNFIGDAKINGIDSIMINGIRYFLGKPPIRKDYQMPDFNLSEMM